MLVKTLLLRLISRMDTSIVEGFWFFRKKAKACAISSDIENPNDWRIFGLGDDVVQASTFKAY